MPKHHDLVDISCLLKFYPKTGKSVAVTDGIKEDIIFLPLSEVEIEETGRFEDGLQLVTITMPTWLAEEKGLV